MYVNNKIERLLQINVPVLLRTDNTSMVLRSCQNVVKDQVIGDVIFPGKCLYLKSQKVFVGITYQ